MEAENALFRADDDQLKTFSIRLYTEIEDKYMTEILTFADLSLLQPTKRLGEIRPLRTMLQSMIKGGEVVNAKIVAKLKLAQEKGYLE